MARYRPTPVLLVGAHFQPHAPYRTGSYESEVTAADGAVGGFFNYLRSTHTWSDTVMLITVATMSAAGTANIQ